jgi:hypothetical protein
MSAKWNQFDLMNDRVENPMFSVAAVSPNHFLVSPKHSRHQIPVAKHCFVARATADNDEEM